MNPINHPVTHHRQVHDRPKHHDEPKQNKKLIHKPDNLKLIKHSLALSNKEYESK